MRFLRRRFPFKSEFYNYWMAQSKNERSDKDFTLNNLLLKNERGKVRGLLDGTNRGPRGVSEVKDQLESRIRKMERKLGKMNLYVKA